MVPTESLCKTKIQTWSRTSYLWWSGGSVICSYFRLSSQSSHWRFTRLSEVEEFKWAVQAPQWLFDYHSPVTKRHWSSCGCSAVTARARPRTSSGSWMLCRRLFETSTGQRKSLANTWRPDSSSCPATWSNPALNGKWHNYGGCQALLK